MTDSRPTVFLDTWALGRLLDTPRLQRLFLPSESAGLRATLSLYQFYEISKTTDEGRRHALTGLAKALMPSWIKVLPRLLADETRRAFLEWLSLSSPPVAPFCNSFHAALLDINRTSEAEHPTTPGLDDAVEYGARNPEIFASIEDSRLLFGEAISTCRDHREFAVASAEMLARLQMAKNLPLRTPAGLLLPDRRVLLDFATRYDLRNSTLLSLNAETYRVYVSRRAFDANDGIDRMMVVPAVLYCDGATADGFTESLIGEARRALGVTTARVYTHNTLEELEELLKA